MLTMETRGSELENFHHTSRQLGHLAELRDNAAIDHSQIHVFPCMYLILCLYLTELFNVRET